TIAGASRDAPGLITTSGAAHASVGSPVHGKPQELFLTRAHSAVFDVRKLKSLVIKKERPEHEDPLGASDEAAAADMPAALDSGQMVQPSGATPNTSS